jgi:hypothetical protein
MALSACALSHQGVVLTEVSRGGWTASAAMRLIQRLRHARMIFTKRAVGRSLGTKTTVATSAVTGNAMIAIVKAGPLMGRDRVTVGLLFLPGSTLPPKLWFGQQCAWEWTCPSG